MIKSTFSKIVATLIATYFLTAPALEAQQPINSVEVLVNDEPISSFDINQRLRLVIAISGGVNSEQDFLRIRGQVIQSIVDERLQLQEAQEFELNIPQDQLNDFFARRAQGTGQTPEQFELALSTIGSSKETMMEQINAEFAWSELVQGRLGQFVNVTDEEIESYIERIKSNRGKVEHRLSEIVLLVNNSEQEASVKATAEDLARRIREGASFPDLAQQLSASPTAAVGGILGWITENDLNRYQLEAIQGLEPGDVSDPVRTAGGYLLINLADSRRILTADPLDDQVLLRQIFLSNVRAADANIKEKFEQTLATLDTSNVSCNAVPELVEKSGADPQMDIGAVVIRSMSKKVRKILAPMEIGQATDIITMEDGLRILVICDREKSEIIEPDFDIVKNQLEQQRLSLMGRRYLRDIRRKAIVDYR